MRTAIIERKTTETAISLELNLDGKGIYSVDTGCGFLDHMLELFTRYSRFDLTVNCKGDTKVDYHHTTEDIGIALGNALKNALNDAKGINRYGNFYLPMDESLVLCAVDISGRAYCSCNLELNVAKVGDFDTELVEEFFMAFCRSAGVTLHIVKQAGTNTHHIIEAAFKGFGKAMRQAVAIDEAFANEVPSTKGVL